MKTDARQFSSRRSARSGRFGTVLAAAALLAAGCIAVWKQHDAKQGAPAGEPLLADFAAVWSWSERSFIGGADSAKWTIRWDEDGAWKAETARGLAVRLGIALMKQSGNQLTGSGSGYTVYTGEKKTVSGMGLTIWLQMRSGGGGEDSVSNAVVLLQPAAGTGEAPIRQAALDVLEAAKEAGLSLKGSFAVRGKPTSKEAASHIAEAADAGRREGYDDGNTRSVTYFSPRLRSGVTSGGKRVNLQIAESGPAGGGDAELIVGVPLITGDYSLQN